MPPVRRPSLFRIVLGAFAAIVLLGAGIKAGYPYLLDPSVGRPTDYLEVWAAGRLTLTGENPYDGPRMYEVQTAANDGDPPNRCPEWPNGYAGMMWVPPWGLAVAMPIGALSVGAGQAVWVLGQFALIFVAALVLWHAYGGQRDRWVVPVLLTLSFGPVWWQTAAGQFAGLLFAGLAGFVWAHRAGRPVVGGAWLALAALKPHLLLLLAVGLLIDATRTAWGRRVVLGGVLALAAAGAAATAANPNVWGEYVAATTGPRSPYYPAVSDWFNPTVGSWVRHALPGQPFWVQCVPAAVAVAAFAVYWWRHGSPDRWPDVLVWVVPVGLLVAPYGSWPSDLVLMLVPITALAVRLDARGWQVPGRWPAAVAYAVASGGVIALQAANAESRMHVWVAPVLCGCLIWAAWATRQPAPAPRPRTLQLVGA